MARRLSYSREIKIAFFAVVVLAMAVLVFATNLGNATDFVQNLDLEKYRDYIASYGALAPLVLFLLQALQAIIPILPGSVITIAGGLLLGELEGAVISYFGTLLGATVVFYLSKYFGRGFVEWLLHKKDLGAYDKMFQNNGFVITFLLRAIPFVDFGFASYLISISSITFKEYFIGTAIGIIPTVLIYSYYGAAFLQNPLVFSILGLVFLLLFLLAPYLMKKLTKRAPGGI